jgi:2-oxoacid:acceptor oxidoreductase gamma subunit (pyruvate/2-ketoisovalerate family)
MVEIKFKGRGGQGAVIASQILAKPYFIMGKYVQCFSVFGGERRGAPVDSFLRVDDSKILLKCEIHRPDQLICMAPDMVDEHAICSTLKPDGLVLINDSLSSNDFKSLRRFNLALVDALSVAEQAGLGAAIEDGDADAVERAIKVHLDESKESVILNAFKRGN